MPLFELAHVCFNCQRNQFRLGERCGVKTEFICTTCGGTRYFNVSPAQFAYMVGAE
jgi:hypothetical protein